MTQYVQTGQVINYNVHKLTEDSSQQWSVSWDQFLSVYKLFKLIIHSISTPIWRVNSFFNTKASCSQIDQQPQITDKRYKIKSNACDTWILRVTENMYMQWQYTDDSKSDISNNTKDNY